MPQFLKRDATETGTPLQVTPVEPEPEKPSRKPRVKQPVCIYQIQGDNRLLVKDEKNLRRDFDSTYDAVDWLKKNAKTNGAKYEVVTIHRSFTIKAEPQIKITLG